MTIYIPEELIWIGLFALTFVGGFITGCVCSNDRELEKTEKPIKPTYKQLNDIARMMGFNISIHRIKEIIARWEETKYL